MIEDQNTCLRHFEIDRLKRTKSSRRPKIYLRKLEFIIGSLGNTAIGHDEIHNRCLENGTKRFY